MQMAIGRRAADLAGGLSFAVTFKRRQQKGVRMDRMERRIANRWEEMPEIVEMLERFGSEHRLSTQVISDLNVVLDEVLSNVISHAYERDARSEILVRLEYRPDQVVVEVEDAGKPFDPLQAPPPDLTGSLQTRQVGGLGIHFIKSLMDEVAYTRVDGKNRLCLRKRLPVGSESATGK
jgi:serine/threonine-protein kinase RsbW